MVTYVRATIIAAVTFYQFAPLAGLFWFFILVVGLKGFESKLQPPYDTIFGITSIIFALVSSIAAYYYLIAQQLAKLPNLAPDTVGMMTLISGTIVLGIVIVLLALALSTLRFGW